MLFPTSEPLYRHRLLYKNNITFTISFQHLLLTSSSSSFQHLFLSTPSPLPLLDITPHFIITFSSVLLLLTSSSPPPPPHHLLLTSSSSSPHHLLLLTSST